MTDERPSNRRARRIWWLVLGAADLLRERSAVLSEELLQRGEKLDGPVRSRVAEWKQTVVREVDESVAALGRALGRPVRGMAGVGPQEVRDVEVRLEDLERRVRSTPDCAG